MSRADLVPKAVRADDKTRRRLRADLKRAFVWGSKTCPLAELVRRVQAAERILNGEDR